MLNRLAEELDSLSASLLHVLLSKVIPISWQHYARDLGFFQVLSDSSFYTLGLVCGLLNPSLLQEYRILLRQARRVRYSPHASHFALELPPLAAIHAPPAAPSPPSPPSLLVFVHGGAWGSGRPWQYLLLAQRMARLLHIPRIAVISYPLYPCANIPDQGESVAKALEFYKGEKVVLCGHSSGANVSLIALLRLSCPWVSLFLGLNGVYEVERHIAFERERGVQALSPLSAACAGRERESSPELLLGERGEKGEGSLPPLLLFHGWRDRTAPLSCSLSLSLVAHRGGERVALVSPPTDHLSPLLALLEGEEGQERGGLSLLREVYFNLLRERQGETGEERGVEGGIQ